MKNVFVKIAKHVKAHCFLIINVFVFLFTFVQKNSPEIKGASLYAYEYGIIYPWFIIYKNTNEGCNTLLYTITRKGYCGIEIWPQYILVSSIFIYFFIKVIYHPKYLHHYLHKLKVFFHKYLL